MLLRDERAHFRFRIRARSDFEAANLRRQRGDQPVRGRFAHRDRDGNRHATFAGGTKSSAHESVDRLVHVGIGHDDHVVLGAAQRLATLSCRRGRLIDVPCDRVDPTKLIAEMSG